MHPDDFAKIVRHRFARCEQVLVEKGKEYSRNDDRLHNFKVAAAMDGSSPTMSLWGMWKKHLVSIIDMVDDIERGIIPSEKMVDEKLCDNINYSILFEGLIAEQREAGRQQE